MTTSTSFPTLSDREKDIISLLSLGLDSQAIAETCARELAKIGVSQAPC